MLKYERRTATAESIILYVRLPTGEDRTLRVTRKYWEAYTPEFISEHLGVVDLVARLKDANQELTRMLSGTRHTL